MRRFFPLIGAMALCSCATDQMLSRAQGLQGPMDPPNAPIPPPNPAYYALVPIVFPFDLVTFPIQFFTNPNNFPNR